MKKGYIFLIVIGIILAVLTISGFVLSQIKQDTFIVNVRLEGSAGYPPRLTQIVNEGVTQENALVSIMPQLSIGSLSITTPHTTISGIITIDCGGTYNETKEFVLSTNNPGDKMTKEFLFKDIPKERVCQVVAQVLECETQQPRCDKNSMLLVIKTP